VIGGGMMGLACALALIARGRAVCVVEADTCGAGASGRSSGFITPDSELELGELMRRFGPDSGRRLWEFARGGVESIRAAVLDHGIDCDYRVQDALFVGRTKGGGKRTREEHEARQACGYASAFYDRESLPAILGSTGYFGGVRFGETFGIDAYRCCVGLRDQVVKGGGRVFEQSPVTRLLPDGVETSSGRVRAESVLVCADRFLPSLGLARSEIYHAQTFLGISEPLVEADAARMFPLGPLMVWDTDLFYTYFRLVGDRRLLIGGGTLATTYSRRERHDPAEVSRRMRGYLAKSFPDLRVTFEAAWPGLIGITKDFSPVVGRDLGRPSVRFAGGAAGLPWAAALGRYLADKILDGRDDLDSELSARRRFPVGRRVQAVIGKPPAFAIAHGLVKQFYT
jgi:gamma-glutamylputrescine oxidase